jgi:predicted S18 family serine protease
LAAIVALALVITFVALFALGALSANQATKAVIYEGNNAEMAIIRSSPGTQDGGGRAFAETRDHAQLDLMIGARDDVLKRLARLRARAPEREEPLVADIERREHDEQEAISRVLAGDARDDVARASFDASVAPLTKALDIATDEYIDYTAALLGDARVIAETPRCASP